MNRTKFSSLDSGNIKNDEEVTIIIAAYLRYDSLNIALQSVYNQTYEKWNVLIVADCCDDHFVKNVDLSDPRVKLINLPMRCGNQYGPNSVGIHMATTEYIAFLNHDDLWLSDHIETAINTMNNNLSEFFIGKAAFCHNKHQEYFDEQDERSHFSEINNPEPIWRCIYGPNEFFEPASSWVIKTKLAKKVGYWFAPDKTIKTPLMDWLSRAVREKTVISYSNKVTTLKFNLHPFLSKPYFSRMVYYLRFDKIVSYYILNLIFRIENKLIIWLSYLLFPIRTIFKNNTAETQPKYLSKEIDLNKVKFYLYLNPSDTRAFIKNDINEALKNKLVTKNISIELLIKNKKEQRIIDNFQKYIATGIIDQEQKNKTIYSSKYFKSLLYDRTGENINSFIPPETIINELTQCNII